MPGRSYATERNFGLVVGGVFTGLAGWWLWRGKFPGLAPYVLGLGVLLMLLGFAYPRVLVIPNRLWMGVAAGMSFVMTRVILALVFFLLVGADGVFRKKTGGDPRARAPT